MRYTSLIIATGFCLLHLGCQAKKDLENCQIEKTQVQETLTEAYAKNKDLSQNILLIGKMLNESVEKMKEEKTALTTQISGLEKQLEEAGRRAKDYQVQMEERLKTLSAAAEAKIKELKARLAQVQAALTAAESDNKRLSDQIAQAASAETTSDQKAESVE